MTSFIAHGEKADEAYKPSFAFDGPLLTERQGAIHDAVGAVPGWLEPGDSLKLYELGYLAPGPFLEIGTYCGKSTTILATAIRDSGRHVDFYSLDVGRDYLESARATLAARGLGPYVTLIHGSVEALLQVVPAFRPRFVFLDGDHSVDGVRRDLAALEERVPEGGLLLFHDFTTSRNDDPADKAYGVPQGIRTSWVARDCEFAGTFGCAALYRRLRGPQGGDPATDPPALVGLFGLDRLRLRIRVKVVIPAKLLAGRARRRLRGKPPG
jgi:Methyltransferase domain